MMIVPDNFCLDSVRLNQVGPGPGRTDPGKMMREHFVDFSSMRSEGLRSPCGIPLYHTIETQKHHPQEGRNPFSAHPLRYSKVCNILERPQCGWDGYPTPG